jgi:hypothetical protein
VKACPNCGECLSIDEVDDFHFCDECGWIECDERDNGPTGHGDICHSDADPGL